LFAVVLKTKMPPAHEKNKTKMNIENHTFLVFRLDLFDPGRLARTGRSPTRTAGFRPVGWVWLFSDKSAESRLGTARTTGFRRICPGNGVAGLAGSLGWPDSVASGWCSTRDGEGASEGHYRKGHHVGGKTLMVSEFTPLRMVHSLCDTSHQHTC
jgi:hypothetical protein